MATWLIPALKAVLPHIGTIISAATPVFTKKQADAAANQVLLLQQQITELQSAASQNAALIKELAAQLQSTVAALEQAASAAEARLRRATALSVVAALMALGSLGAEDLVGVYLPQSYNFAGQFVLVPRSRVTSVTADSAEVMAMIVSGGVSGGEQHRTD